MDLVAWRERLGVSSVGLEAPGTPRPALTASIAAAALPPPPPAEGCLTPEAKRELGLRMLEAGIVELARSGLPIVDVGLQAACGPLESFFAEGFENATSPHPEIKKIDGAILREVLGAVLSDKFGAFRFRRGEDDPQLASLNEKQKKEWSRPAEYLSLSLSPDSAPKLELRAQVAAALASEALVAVAPKLGSLEAARQRQAAVVATLREIPKDQRERRIAAGEEAQRCGAEVRLLEHLTELAELDPKRADPERLETIGGWLQRFGGELGPERLAAFAEASKTDDLEYRRGLTYEDPPASTRLKLSAIGCMSWPDPTVLSECIDANKHLVCTDSEVYGIVQGTLRIVESEEGRGPMLLLERLYPDAALEEKARLIEHALRRAEAMDMPLLLPEEYFWSCDRWSRVAPDGNNVRIPPMNEVLPAIAAKLDGARFLEPIEVKMKAVIGQVGTEYIDSAPVGGAKNRGEAQVRRYGPQDAMFDNSCCVMVPKTASWETRAQERYEFEPLFPAG